MSQGSVEKNQHTNKHIRRERTPKEKKNKNAAVHLPSKFDYLC